MSSKGDEEEEDDGPCIVSSDIDYSKVPKGKSTQSGDQSGGWYPPFAPPYGPSPPAFAAYGTTYGPALPYQVPGPARAPPSDAAYSGVWAPGSMPSHAAPSGYYFVPPAMRGAPLVGPSNPSQGYMSSQQGYPPPTFAAPPKSEAELWSTLIDQCADLVQREKVRTASVTMAKNYQGTRQVQIQDGVDPWTVIGGEFQGEDAITQAKQNLAQARSSIRATISQLGYRPKYETASFDPTTTPWNGSWYKMAAALSQYNKSPGKNASIDSPEGNFSENDIRIARNIVSRYGFVYHSARRNDAMPTMNTQSRATYMP